MERRRGRWDLYFLKLNCEDQEEAELTVSILQMSQLRKLRSATKLSLLSLSPNSADLLIC